MTPAHVVPALVAEVTGHTPRDEREAWSRRRTLAMLRWLPAPLDRGADPWHVTGSAVVRAADGAVLLHRHKRLGRWLQPGGHLEPGEHPSDAAVRETLEETGAAVVHPGGRQQLIHVDVHEGPRGHVHLDLRYLLLADRDMPLAPADGESQDVDWFTPAGVRLAGDASLVAAVRAAAALVPARGPRPTVTTPRGDPRSPR